jgi:hypothetical protein
MSSCSLLLPLSIAMAGVFHLGGSACAPARNFVEVIELENLFRFGTISLTHLSHNLHVGAAEMKQM